MLTRIYIDNFRCFTNFEFKPRRKELIFGENGSGKSSFSLALLHLRQFLMNGLEAKEYFSHFDLCRFGDSAPRSLVQRFELEAATKPGAYTYQLSIRHVLQPRRVEVWREALLLNGNPVFEATDGRATLLPGTRDSASYPFNSERSPLAVLRGAPGLSSVQDFFSWIASLYCFKLNPFDASPYAELDDAPRTNLLNYASWYQARGLGLQAENQRLLEDLRSAIDGFAYLSLEPVERGRSTLWAEFQGSPPSRFRFDELSDGQRCLICLYTIVRFLIGRGALVLIDEPDNFVGLREIQPWLAALDDAVDDSGGQALLISHHPELLNQWAPSFGSQFFRSANGPVRVKPFRYDADTALGASELIARGWLHE